jgi:hypothetical protein
MLWAATERLVVVNIAIPEELKVIVPSKVPLPQGAGVSGVMCGGVRPLPARTFGINLSTTLGPIVPPSQKMTLPSGDPVGAGVTVAVNVTVWPKVAGFGRAVSAVDVAVGSALIVSVATAEVVVRKFVLPE